MLRLVIGLAILNAELAFFVAYADHRRGVRAAFEKMSEIFNIHYDMGNAIGYATMIALCVTAILLVWSAIDGPPPLVKNEGEK